MSADHHAIRILHVASGDLWAGAEAQVAQLIGALRRQPDLELAAVLLNEGELASRLRAMAIETLIVPEHTSLPYTIYRRLLAFMRHWNPDVVHTHRQKENILGSLAARTAKVPVCLRTAHGATEFGLKPWQLPRRTLRGLDRWIARTLQQRTVAVSEELALKLADSMPGASICFIPNGIDVEATRDAAAPPIPLPANLSHVAFIGRLVPVKRLDVFLEAAAELLRGEPDKYLFHIIGDGPLRADLEQLSVELGISSHCEFHGFHADAQRWLAAMDCLVLTSDHEGLPMTCLEAMALGVPVVAHAVGGLSALLQGADNCRLVATQEPHIVAEGIRSTARLPRDRRKSRLPAQYDIDCTSSGYADLYKTLLQRRRN